MKAELAALESPFETSDELSPKDALIKWKFRDIFKFK